MNKRILMNILVLSIITVNLTSCYNRGEETVDCTPSDHIIEKSPEMNDMIIEIIENMSIDDKIAQLIIIGYDNIDEIKDDFNYGGVILYSKNIKTVSQTFNDIKTIKDKSKGNILPFISVDQEGGRVNRLPSECGIFESAMAIGNKNNKKYAYESGVKTAKALKKLGVNLNFAPVLDIYSNPSNTVIADRAYGKTAERVTNMGLEVMKGLRDNRIIPTVKHFPGHGDTGVDSHIGLPVVTKTIDKLNEFELRPFKSAIENNAQMIMVAHILLSDVDTVPATMSYEIITRLLREKMGYDGVVITDDLCMGAIRNEYEVHNAAVNSFKAGCDILLIAQNGKEATLTYEAIKKAYEEGIISMDRINESLYRILSLKNEYGLIK